MRREAGEGRRTLLNGRKTEEGQILLLYVLGTVPCYTRQLKISGIVLRLFFVVEMNLKCHLVVHLFLHRGGSDVTLMTGSGR